MKEKDLQRLISLTFDESPAVRKKAALELAKIDDPAAVFALIELSYDKDKSVSETARKILEEKRKNSKEEFISFAELFSAGKPKEEKEDKKPAALSKKKKLLQPIEKLFEKKLGKEKAEKIKAKMMPTIEKIYDKVIEKKVDERQVQSLLTSYLDAIGSMPVEQENVGKVEELKELEKLEEIPEVEVEEKEELPKEEGFPSVFGYAYEVMMASEGDERVMKREVKRLKKFFSDQVELAFKLARQKFREKKITRLTDIKDGMRNVTTDVLLVVDVQHGEYQKTKTKRDVYTRILVRDSEGNEGVVYLFEGRGQYVKPGMKIKVEKGIAKAFRFSGETGLTVGKRGNVYIVL